MTLTVTKNRNFLKIFSITPCRNSENRLLINIVRENMGERGYVRI